MGRGKGPEYMARGILVGGKEYMEKRILGVVSAHGQGHIGRGYIERGKHT